MKAKLVWLILSWILGTIFFGSDIQAATAWRIEINEPSDFGSIQWCPSYRMTIRVMGNDAVQEACMYGGDTFQFGVTAQSRYQLVAKHFLDESFRPVRIDCEGGCLYSAEADLLIMRRPGLVVNVFTHASQKLKVGDVVSYDLDVTHPDYQLVDTVGSFAVSENGEWLVVEVKNRGVDRINLQTHERSRVIQPGVAYGFGHDPVEELAVSNDGMYVAQMGEEAGFLVVEVTEPCDGSCPAISMSVADITPRFYFAGHPRFDSGSNRLSFYVATHGQGSRRVTIQKPDYHNPGVSYLALGDSFTSGEGEVNDRFYRLVKEDIFSRCHQSVRAYPMLLSVRMGVSATDSHSVACAGARIQDITNQVATYWGQASGLSNISEFERRRLQSEALEAFLPGRIPQSAFVEQYQPSMVTLGIGGNDAGLMSKLKTCAMPDLCEWAEDPMYRFATAVEIQRLFYSLKEVYARVHHQSFSTRMYAVGYPEIIDPDGVCGPITSTLLTYSERLFMQQGIRYLNQVIRAAAESSGVQFLDVEGAFTGSRLCDVGVPAVNGLRLGDDVAVLSPIKIIGNESFHPTPYGHQRLSEAIPDLRAAGIMSNSAITEPPPIPPYWGMSTNQRFTAFYDESISLNHISLDAPDVIVQVPPQTFTPHSWVDMELHSKEGIENRVKVSEDGGFRTKLIIDPELSIGYHTLHIFGESYSGRLVDVYKIVSYGDVEQTVTTQQIYSTSIEPTVEILGIAAVNDKERGHVSPSVIKNKLESFVSWISFFGVVLGGLLITLFLVRRLIKSAQDRGG